VSTLNYIPSGVKNKSMDIDRLEVKKIIEQEVTPRENLIVWTDVYIKGIQKTYDEQIMVYNVEPSTAKQRIIEYVNERLQNELRE